MSQESDGFEEVVLAKEWLGSAPKHTVRVDPERAEQMRRDGLADPPAVAPKPRRNKSRKE